MAEPYPEQPGEPVPARKSIKQQLKALHNAASVVAARKAALRAAHNARKRTPKPPADVDDSPAQTLVRRYCTWEEHAGLWEPKFTGYSDGSGGMVERANAKYWMDHFPDLFVEVFGGYGTVWTGMPHDTLAHVGQDDYENLEGDLQGLEKYPLLDEELYSRMEDEAKQDYWDKEGRNELRTELLKQADDSLLASLGAIYMSDEELDEIFHQDDEDYMQIETGGSVYFRAEKAAQSIPNDVLVDMAEGQPKLAGAERKALYREWPQFLAVVKEVAPDYVDQFTQASEGHAYGIFQKLQDKAGLLWDIDADAGDDPSKNLTLNLGNVREALYELTQEMMRSGKPEDPRQLRLPLSKREAMKLANAQEIVEALLEGFKEKKAAFIAAGADPAAVDAAIAEFKRLKSRNMLTPEEVDIDRYGSFEELQAFVEEAGSRTRGAAAKTRTFQVRDDAELIHDDENVTIVVPNTYEASKFYGKGTKWCIASVDYPGHFATYRKDLAKHYMFLFKKRSSSDPYYKVALTVYPGRRMAHDATDAQMDIGQFKELTGFDPNDPTFAPWDWHTMPPHERWKVAKREQGMTFMKFASEVDEPTWDAIGDRATALKQQWFQAQKTEAETKGQPEPDEAQLQADWLVFWREARNEALADPNDKEYLDTLQYYIDMTESRRTVASELARLLLEGLLPEGAVKDWIMSITDVEHVRRELHRVSKGQFYKGAAEPYQAHGLEEPDIQHHQAHGPLP